MVSKIVFVLILDMNINILAESTLIDFDDGGISQKYNVFVCRLLLPTYIYSGRCEREWSCDCGEVVKSEIFNPFFISSQNLLLPLTIGEWSMKL